MRIPYHLGVLLALDFAPPIAVFLLLSASPAIAAEGTIVFCLFAPYHPRHSPSPSPQMPTPFTFEQWVQFTHSFISPRCLYLKKEKPAPFNKTWKIKFVSAARFPVFLMSPCRLFSLSAGFFFTCLFFFAACRSKILLNLSDPHCISTVEDCTPPACC